jgi:hypothetical protein
MFDSTICPDCNNNIPQPANCCPHCGQRGIFWNVIRANNDDERAALQSRYDAAKDDARSRGVDSIVEDFEKAIAAGSKAVLARSDIDVQRLANSANQVYGTFYQEIEAGLRLPDSDEWNAARELADVLLFADYRQHIRFASLSLDGTGLSKFGSCSITLREDMIAHRTSVLDENSVLFMERQKVTASRTSGVPKGYRAAWSERSKLCIAKLAGRIDSTTKPNQYSGLLIKQGANSEDDEFVEVHIFGPITVLTMAEVTITTPKARPRATIVRAIKSKLEKHGVLVKY